MEIPGAATGAVKGQASMSVGASTEVEDSAARRRQVERVLREKQRLNELLLDSLPHPALLLAKDGTILAANRIAREVGAAVDDYCWRSFAHSEHIPDEDKAYVDAHGEPPPGGTRCTFCLAHQMLADGGPVTHPGLKMFGRTWETYWVPLGGETYLHYAIDVTDRERPDEGFQARTHELGERVTVRARTAAPGQGRVYLVPLGVVAVFLALAYPLAAVSGHKSGADMHGAIEAVGALFGLIAGIALLARFYVLGNRLHLFIGLAFFVNGAEDLVHGLISFHNLFGLPASSLSRFIPGTYVTGRLLLGALLLGAPFLPKWLGPSSNPKRETQWISGVVVVITMLLTAVAVFIPLPIFIFPGSFISRPVDFFSAVVLAAALVVFIREYHRGRDTLIWWVALSLVVNLVGQVLMSFSKELYDPFFDIAHVYKAIGYMVPLLGFSIYQIAILTDRRRAEEELRKHRDCLEELVAERTHDLDERIKELDCLYRISSLVEDSGNTLDDLLQGVAELLPSSLQYPEVACARIVVDGQEFKSSAFRESRWRQASDISVHGERVGTVEVCYLEERPEHGGGPFLPEERHLIDAVAQRLGRVVERVRAEEALRESEGKWRSLVANAPNTIITADRDGTIRFINHHVGGMPEEEAVGRKIYDFIPPEYHDVARKTVEQVFEAGKPGGYETIGPGPAGRVSWYKTRVGPIMRGGQVVAATLIATDITERKQAEEALRASEERYRALVSNIPGAVYRAECNPEKWTIHFFSDHIEDILGYPASDFIGDKVRTYASVIHPDDAPMVDETVLDCVGRHAPFGLEYRVLCADGSVRWVHDRGQGAFGEGGELQWLDGVVHDITEHKLAEEALRASEERYRTLIDSAADAIYSLDENGTFLTINRQASQDMGGSPQAILGKALHDVFPKENADGHLASVKKVFQTGKGYSLDAVAVATPAGTRYYSTTLTPVRDLNGTVSSVLGVSRDFTERKRAEDELKESEERFRAIFEGATDGMLLADPESKRFVDGNGAICRMLGYTREELASLGITDIHPEESLPHVLEQFRRQIEGEITVAQDLPVKRKSGAVFHADISGATVEVAGRPCRIGIFRDIDERKRAEAELARLNRQLRETARQAGMAEVASNVLHNVGNVLNSVNISTQLVTSKVKDWRIANLDKVVQLLKEHADDIGQFMATDPKGRRVPEFLEVLAKTLSSEREAMVDELTTVAKHVQHIKEIVSLQQSHARASGVTDRVVVADLVDDAIRINQASMERHEIQVVREHAELPPIVVEAHRLMQILVNLASNARYALIHSERPDKRMTFRTAGTGNDHIRVEIADNGVGIAEENLDRIFTRGFTTKKDGHGFGLHDAAIAAEEMGGTLTVHSDGPGRGALFTLELPDRPPEKKP